MPIGLLEHSNGKMYNCDNVNVAIKLVKSREQNGTSESVVLNLGTAATDLYTQTTLYVYINVT